MNTRNRFVAAVGAALLFVCLTACGSDARSWSHNFKESAAVREAGLHFAPTTSVRVRIVTPEQMDQAYGAARDYYAERKVAAEDASAEELLEARRRAFEVFRIREDPTVFRTIGFARVTDASPIASDDSRLIEVAKSHGAEVVVFSSQYCGSGEVTVPMPISSFSTSRATATAYGSNGTWATGTGIGQTNSLTFVPVSRTVHVWAADAVFLRSFTPEEAARADAPRSAK